LEIAVPMAEMTCHLLNDGIKKVCGNFIYQNNQEEFIMMEGK
jgi:hypothetical protein